MEAGREVNMKEEANLFQGLKSGDYYLTFRDALYPS